MGRIGVLGALVGATHQRHCGALIVNTRYNGVRLVAPNNAPAEEPQYDTRLVTTEEERIQLFVRGLTLELRVLSVHMTSAGKSFSEIVLKIIPCSWKRSRHKKFDDRYLEELRAKIEIGKSQETTLDLNGVLNHKGRIYVPRVDDFIHKLLAESHGSRYFIYPGVTKMYRDLKRVYWLKGLRQNIAESVVKCQNFQQVKYEHKRPTSLIKRMPILEWKWERIAMDFVVGFPNNLRRFDSIWVVVDRLTKSADFDPVRVNY
ncbi:uncharacterized protein LOC107003844 [Solanum pennellii]|uniref:Uncharacterized protein LOC107003844 n=1 Tax=Solanum pennellii TaxID=28526 RepID=A0ABM1FJ32_SOLPN|nr:uncharacterized protein LOC107003844 [Solanum pennellii]